MALSSSDVISHKGFALLLLPQDAGGFTVHGKRQGGGFFSVQGSNHSTDHFDTMVFADQGEAMAEAKAIAETATILSR